MQNREFEKQVQEKMEELHFTPADAVWDKVEATLPAEKKRRWIIFVLLFMFVLGGALILWNNNTPDKKQQLASNAQSSNTVNDSTVKNTSPATQEPIADNAPIKNEIPVTADSPLQANKSGGNKIQSAGHLKIKIKNGDDDGDATNPGGDIIAKNKNQFSTKGASKIKVQSPQQSSEEKEKPVAPIVETAIVINKETIIANADSAAAKKDSLVAVTKIAATDSSVTTKKDTAAIVKKQKENAAKKTKWQYGIEMAAGTFNVKNDLFSSSSVYNANAATYTTPGGPVVIQPNTTPNKPLPGIALSIGAYTQKNIAARWKFKTGINYLFLSNGLKVGSKVDSSTNFNFDMNKSISASSYYHSGSSVTYKNRTHLVEIPLLFQYQLSKKIPVYAEAGPGIAYLLHSNALVYNTSSQAYVADKNIYNKLILSFNAGFGITLAPKAKLPVTTGFMFKYGAGSLVKNSFGKQHLANGLFYVRVPLKK